eukprot:scaffold6829_cov171-Amphora_coffeaeformis.AAC.23
METNASFQSPGQPHLRCVFPAERAAIVLSRSTECDQFSRAHKGQKRVSAEGIVALDYVVLVCSSSAPPFILHNAAKRLPRQLCTCGDAEKTSERAPGRHAKSGAPIACAKTTAKAEFCIPTSMLTVRAVRSDVFAPNRGTA